jgi:hypothetical protein
VEKSIAKRTFGSGRTWECYEWILSKYKYVKIGVILLLYYRHSLLTPAKTINHVECELETDVPEIYSLTVRNTEPDDRDNK